MTGSVRPRRLRAKPALRRLVTETRVSPSQLVLPVFVREGLDGPRAISSLPGVSQHSLASLANEVQRAAAAGLGGVMLFAVPTVRDATGTAAVDPDGILNRAIAVARDAAAGRLVVMADLCLDEFTDHGHCGVLAEDGTVDNDATLAVYRRMGLAQAEAGADVLGLSGMMDGQVAAVRDALDAAGRTDVVILAYAAKYASAFYGPFREAAESTPAFGDRRSHQMDPANAREALRQVALDIDQGADMVMVKPALPYLDILWRVKDTFGLPTVAYHVSGEYSMVKAAGANGWIDEPRAMMESLISIRRAGADAIITYYARDAARVL